MPFVAKGVRMCYIVTFVLFMFFFVICLETLTAPRDPFLDQNIISIKILANFFPYILGNLKPNEKNVYHSDPLLQYKCFFYMFLVI